MKLKRLPFFCKSMLAALCLLGAGMTFTSCDDDSEDLTQVDRGAPFDPSQPVYITSFTPTTGGYQDRIIIYGSNFGIVKENVNLTIGGKPVVIATIRDNAIYGYVPSTAYDNVETDTDAEGNEVNKFTGEMHIVVSDGNGNTQEATAPGVFTYTPKKVVGTLCGSTNDYETQGEVFGSFEEARGFAYETTMEFDPEDPDMLYMPYDMIPGWMPNGGAWGGYIVKIDFKNQRVERAISASKFGNRRLNDITFTKDGQYMVASVCAWDQQERTPSIYMIKRDAKGGFSDNSDIQIACRFNCSNGICTHPVNGEIYFFGYPNANLLRFDPEDYFAGVEAGTWTGLQADGAYEEVFRVFDVNYTSWLAMHPSGNYMYITCDNVHTIYRSDYDWDAKTFTTPYAAAGTLGGHGYKDAVGNEARLAFPHQGCWVPNQQYIDEGRADIYDYYFADSGNYCIRKLTPDGVVSTVAGRGQSTDGNLWGMEDGDPRADARFRDIHGMAYDAKRDRIYTCDPCNYRIRYYGLDSVVDENTGDDNGDNGDNGDNAEPQGAKFPPLKPAAH